MQFLQQTIHIVGLGVDVTHPGLEAVLAHNRHCRIPRAQAMAQQLQAVGIADPYAGALRYAPEPALIARTHFARHLVDSGHCRNLAEVFRRYLSAGKPGYLPPAWVTLAEGVAAITAAGGVAVLAHPARYKLPALQEDLLFHRFVAAGGQALEVVTSSHQPPDIQHYTRLAQRWALAASCGSDFHSPGESRHDLGALAALPAGLEPVWRSLGHALQPQP